MPTPTRRATRTRPSSLATRSFISRQRHSLSKGRPEQGDGCPLRARSPGRPLGQAPVQSRPIGLGLGVGLLIGVFGWEIALIVSAVHASTYVLGGGAINAIGHKWGKRPHDNLATNNQWLAWFVAGEGLHNNHHAVTTSGRLSMAKGEIDPGWWAIRLMVLLRLGRRASRQGGAQTLPGRPSTATGWLCSGIRDISSGSAGVATTAARAINFGVLAAWFPSVPSQHSWARLRETPGA